MNELTQVTGPSVQAGLYDPLMQEHRDFQIAQNSWREIAATIVQTFVWFTNITVLPDGDLRAKTLHVGCAEM